jgi:hypothetical protein
VPARVATRDLVIAADEEFEGVSVDSSRRVNSVRIDEGGTVDGSVKDASGRAVGLGRIRLLDVIGEAHVTGKNGEFAYRGVPPGLHVVSIEAIGFEPARRAVIVGAGDTAHVEVRLGRLATLATVTIKERERIHSLKLEIESRLAGGGGGYISDSTKLAKMPALYHAFQVPGARVTAKGSSFAVEVSRVSFSKADHWCTPQVFIDDAPADADQLNGYPKQAIALLEFYTRAANAPSRYTGSGTGSSKGASDGKCGVILAWTKSFMSAGDLTGKPYKKP